MESTECDCAKYDPLGLDNKSIYKRIQEAKVLLVKLKPLASFADGEHTLLRCPGCGQFWQSSRARLWGNNPYCFKVPSIELQAWSTLPFVPPDELIEYNKAILEYKSRQTFHATRTNASRPAAVNQLST